MFVGLSECSKKKNKYTCTRHDETSMINKTFLDQIVAIRVSNIVIIPLFIDNKKNEECQEHSYESQ